MTWLWMDYSNKKKSGGELVMGVCPYKNECMKYNDYETRAAMKRVVMLLKDNMEDEEMYKRELYKYILNTGVNSNETEGSITSGSGLCNKCIGLGSETCLGGSGGCGGIGISMGGLKSMDV